MRNTFKKLSPSEVQVRLQNSKSTLVDIREIDEFSRNHINGAQSQPLSTWVSQNFDVFKDKNVILMCRTGTRTYANEMKLVSAFSGEVSILEGGLEAWKKAGLPVIENKKAPMEINRQVQIIAGSLTFLGILLGLLIHPLWFALSAFIGAGLTFSGATGSCTMARIISLAPWNRKVTI